MSDLNPAERPRRVVLATTTPTPEDRRWIAALADRWPRQTQPINPETIELAGLRAAFGEAPPPDAVVIRVKRETEPRSVREALDLLHETMIPGVLLAPLENPSRAIIRAIGQAEADGIAALPEALEPGRVAVALHSILRRQPTVERVRDELALAHATARSIRGELETVHEELRQAARLQRELVQGLEPNLPGISAGAVYRPASYVSGDLYSVERLDQHHTGVFLADVAGHGVPAALLTLFVARSLPRVDGPIEDPADGTLDSGRIALRRIVPPGEAMARLNRSFLAQMSAGSRFATAVYAVIDTRTNTVTMASAGHPPPMLVKRSGEMTRLEEGGPLLGVFGDQPFPETRFTLRFGEALLFYTDGFESAFAENEGPRGREHLTRLERIAHETAEANDALAGVAALELMLDSALGSLHPTDDVTALIITPTRDAGSVAAVQTQTQTQTQAQTSPALHPGEPPHAPPRAA